ncbi:hypothetical protein E5288_WYG009741 [Bos mutus]|uniref:Uncharacterized protein n=1 Tax=Bos mutus TaxID=72004 RepID=A0A6B0R2F5_9CETA|nr:hypothetical protein [Bos mutus]
MDRMASSMKQVPNPLPKVLSRRGVGAGMEAAERESFERTQRASSKGDRGPTAPAALEPVAGQDLLHQSLYFNQTRKFELLHSVAAECWDQKRAQGSGNTEEGTNP